MQRDTLKDRALNLLCEVVATNAEGKSVGSPYGEIAQILVTEFPRHEWDLPVSLRWYANKIRCGEFPGHDLPNIRPTTSWPAVDGLSPRRSF